MNSEVATYPDFPNTIVNVMQTQFSFHLPVRMSQIHVGASLREMHIGNCILWFECCLVGSWLVPLGGHLVVDRRWPALNMICRIGSHAVASGDAGGASKRTTEQYHNVVVSLW